MKKELAIHTKVSRKEDGAIGQITNSYNDAYIIELNGGENPFKCETIVVPEADFNSKFSVVRFSGLRITAAEVDARTERVVNLWLEPAMNMIMHTLRFDNPVPPSKDTEDKIRQFVKDYSTDVVAVSGGELEPKALENRARRVIRMRYHKQEREAIERFNSAKKLVATSQGGPDEAKAQEILKRAEAALRNLYSRQEAAISAMTKRDSAEILGGGHRIAEYLSSIGVSIWLETDIIPRVRQMMESLAEKAGVDPSLVTEEPIDPKVKEWRFKRTHEGDTADDARAEAADKYTERYNREVAALENIAHEFAMKFKKSDEYRAILKVMGKSNPGSLARLVANMNLAVTPAQVLMTLINPAVNMALAPTPRTAEVSKTEQKKLWAKPKSKKFDYNRDRTYAEFAKVSDNPEERMVAHYRAQIKDALVNLDIPRARKYLKNLTEVVATYKAKYEELLKALKSHSRGDAQAAELENRLMDAIGKVGTISEQWEGKPGEPGIKDTKMERKSSALIIAEGQPVHVHGNPSVHVVVSHDREIPGKLYLIPESSINTHERCELVSATIEDITPLRAYAVAKGDVIEAYNTVGRVVDASCKDRGMVYVQLRGCVDIVPVELNQTAIPSVMAEPLKLCICENDGGIITEDQKHECPFHDGKGLLGLPLNTAASTTETTQEPAVDEKAEALKVLNAALESMDLSAMVKAATTPREHTEVYECENEDANLEIGSSVQKFGSAMIGTVMGRRSSAYTVYWESGASSDCWAQELRPVSVKTDGNTH